MSQYKQLPRFKTLPSLVHFFSTRQVGPLGNRDFTSQSSRLQKLLSIFGVSLNDCVAMNQVHGDTISIVTSNNKLRIIPETDGLVTKERNLFLLTKTADCMPVMFYDQSQKIIGLAHIGWSGALKLLGSKMIKKMVELGSNKENIQIGIGPHIQACCYDVPKERIELFGKVCHNNEYYQVRDYKQYLNLKKVLLDQFKKVGVKETQIEVSDICTSCQSELFYSYRQDRKTFGDLQGEFMTLIGVI